MFLFYHYFFVIGSAKEKFNGPIGVNQSNAIPVELLMTIHLIDYHNQHPKYLLASTKNKKSTF